MIIRNLEVLVFFFLKTYFPCTLSHIIDVQKQSYIHKHAVICDTYIYMYNVNELGFGLLDIIICIHENKMIIIRDEEDVNSSL